MSHLTTFKNNALTNTDRAKLCKAVSEIKGLELDLDYKEIKNSYITEQVDAAFVYNSKRIAVGIRFETDASGDEIAVVAGDFYRTGLNQEQITNKIAQVYQKNKVIETCISQSWYTEDVITKENGDMVITAYRYA